MQELSEESLRALGDRFIIAYHNKVCCDAWSIKIGTDMFSAKTLKECVDNATRYIRQHSRVDQD